MNLLLKGHFLFAVLFVSSSALTAEECEPLIKPLSLADPSVMYGRVNVLAGYTDNDIFKAILKQTHSSWLNFTASPSGDSEILFAEENNMNGTCIGSKANMTIEGDTVRGSVAEIHSSFQLLPTCDDCLVLIVNSTAKDVKKVLELFKVENPTSEGIKARSVYLMGKETTVKDSDLEHFKKQASCLGFDGEPDFHYNTDKEFCKEGEGIRLN